jgi:hypothetical protein
MYYFGNVESYFFSIHDPSPNQTWQGYMQLKINPLYEQLPIKQNKKIVRNSLGAGHAKLYFLPDGAPLGENRKYTGTQNEPLFDVYYGMSSWMHLMDALRNEKPIQFFFDDSKNIACVRSAGVEPVGEGE